MMREMADVGIEFAVHCHRHVPLFGPAEEYYQAEVEPCRRWLADVLGDPPVDYIAPFGGQTAGDLSLSEMQNVLREAGFRSCYTTERGPNPGYSRDQLFIKRLDAADLPPRHPLPPEIADL
jgi:peptidoglycan/xylan/chitin deacetylase (PgdA/CDA1 family)